jgi:hypothetical protein
LVAASGRARTAHQRHQVKATTVGWTFPKVSFPRGACAVAQRTA